VVFARNIYKYPIMNNQYPISNRKVRGVAFGSAPEERHVYRTKAPPQPSMLFMRQNAERRGRTEKARLPARQSCSGGNDVVGQGNRRTEKTCMNEVVFRRSLTFGAARVPGRRRGLGYGIAPEERHVYRTESPPQPYTLFMRQNAESRWLSAVPERSRRGAEARVQSSEFGVRGLVLYLLVLCPLVLCPLVLCPLVLCLN
jgi:hypothetical protein